MKTANPRTCMVRVSLLILLLTLTGIVSSQAALIFSEDFSYAPGSLGSNGNWISGSAALVQSATLEPFTSGGLYVPLVGNQVSTSSDGSTSTANLGVSIGGSDGDSFYMSFLAQASYADNSFAGLKLMNNSTAASLFIGQNYGVHVWGIDGGSSGTLSSLSSSDISLIVLSVTYSGGYETINLYINPTSTTLPSTADATLTIAASSYDQLMLQSYNNSLLVDSIKIGSQYTDVVAVPEPSVGIAFVLGIVVIGIRLTTLSRRVNV